MEVPFPRQVWNLHLLRTRTSQHKLDSTIDSELRARPAHTEPNREPSATRTPLRRDPGSARLRPNSSTARAPEASFRNSHGLAEGVHVWHDSSAMDARGERVPTPSRHEPRRLSRHCWPP